MSDEVYIRKRVDLDRDGLLKFAFNNNEGIA